jgi:hypothetical protein
MVKIYKRILWVFFFLMSINTSFAQTVRNYLYTPSSSVFTPLLTPNSVTITGTLDEGYVNNIPVGFNFVYNSVSYTTVAISTNGYVSLGQPISTLNSFTNNLTNGSGTLSPRPILAPLWDNLNFNSATSISYQTTGTAPYRIFTVQWLNAIWGATAANPGISFQLRLKEFDSKIEFIYRPEAGTLLSPTASIGITNAATGSGNFFCLTSTSNNPFDTNSVTEFTALNTKPANGQLYTFAPKYTLPNAPDSLVFTNITATTINVGWVDNTSTETYYQVYMSPDNINFSLLAGINSNSPNGTGLSYQYALTNLLPGNIYYFRVFACNEGSVPINFVADSQATDAGLLTGVKTICPTGCDYTSIGSATNDIRLKGVSGNLALELDATYSPTVETYPLNFGDLYSSSMNNVTIRPRVNVVTPIKFISITSPTFDFNTTDYLTIDGKILGGTKSLIHVSNLSSSGTAIRFINGAVSNTLTDCRVNGASTSLTSGVVTFASTTGTEGNSNNFIMSCIIKDTINTPIYAIYSAGNSNYPNIYNTLYGNNIYDYYNGSNATYGVFLTTGNSSWFIGGNNFYQTTQRMLSFNAAGAIYASSGSGYTIYGNYIGGSEPMCGGSAMNYSGTGYVSLVNMNLPSNITSIIQGNFLQNMNLDLSGSTNTLFGLINGDFLVDANTLGSNLDGNNIVFKSSGTNVTFSPIMVAGGSSYGNIAISSNSISGINISGTGTVYFRGIHIGVTVPSLSITGNLIGSTDRLHNICDSTNHNLFGVFISPGSATNIITDNTIANLTSPGNQTANRLAGIYISSTGTSNVQNNVVYNLTFGGNSTGVGTNTPNIGILHSSSGPDQICNGNLVYGLSNTHSLGATSLTGIHYAASTSGNNVLSKNFVHSLNSYSSGSSIHYGIYNGNSGVMAVNNMVRLGVDTGGSSINLNHIIAGIVDAGNANNYYHNSVYIGGNSVTVSLNNTYAFYNSTASTGVRNIQNNIFLNARSNASGSGKNYAIFLTTGSLTGLEINYNIYFTPGTGGVMARIGGTDYTSLPLWRSTLFLDYNSGYGNPNFVLATGNKYTLSMKVMSPTPAEASGILVSEILDDYEGETRSSKTPTDIGADAGNYAGVDIFIPIINVTPITNTSSTSNRTVFAEIKDIGTGVRRSTTLAPRIWYRRTLPTTSSWVSSMGVLVSGNANVGSWSFSIDYTPIGPAALGQQYQYYIVAQDSASTSNISYFPYPGANHSDVSTQINAPTTPLSYRVVGSLPANISVGIGQTYTTLTGTTGVFNAINTGALSGNTVLTIVSDISEPGTVTLNNSGLGGYNLLIKPDNSIRTLFGAMVANGYGLITINGANNVTIDGGASQKLLIRNSIGTTPNSGTAPAVHFLNCLNDTLKNCILEGNSNSGAYATLYLTTSSISTQTNGLIIHNNIIRPALNNNTNNPITSVLINSVAGNIHNLTLTSNTIIDFTNYGIYVANAGANIAIGDLLDPSKGNRLIQTKTRGNHYHILLGSGSAYSIGNNAMYSTATSSHTASVYGVYAYNNINNVQIVDNSFGGANFDRSGAAYLTSGTMIPIVFAGGSNVNSVISGNRIGNIKLTGTAVVFTGIQVFSGTVTVSNNSIGGASQGGFPYDSISVAYAFYGIRNNSPSEIGCNDNKVSNMYNYGTGYSIGISIEAGVANVTNNIISNIITYGTTLTNVDYSCVGIRFSSNGSGNNIENNQIFDLTNQSTTNGITVTGIAIVSSLSNSPVTRNRIYKLLATNLNTANNSPVLRGIYISGSGTTLFTNNQIVLMPNIIGTQPRVRGIELATGGGNNTFYFNSIYLGGVSAGPNTSSCFLRNTSSTAAGLTLKNNILYNERSGSGNHYALSTNIATNFTHDFNLFVSPLTAAMVEFGIGTSRTLGSWNSFTGNPVNNIQNIPSQLSSDLFFPNRVNGDLFTNACRVADIGMFVTSVTKDYNNNTRSLTPDIGAFEFTISSGQAGFLSQPSNVSISCAPLDTAFTIIPDGLGSTFQWQVNKGTGWTNVANTGVYSGATSTSLRITGANASLNAYQYRCMFTGACLPLGISNVATLLVSNTSTWTGAVGTNWGTAGNWSCGVIPTSTTDVLIPSVSNLPIISDSARFCQNLNINSSASLTLNNTLSSLSIFGNTTLNGTLINSNGTIVFSGDSQQNIPGINYINLGINNPNGAVLLGNVNVSGTLRFLKGIISLGNYNLSLTGTSSTTIGSNVFTYVATTGSGTFNIQNIGTGVRTGPVLFPVGSSTNSYNPISITNAGVADEYRARVLNAVYGNYNASNVPTGPLVPINAVNRTWLLTEQTAGGSNLTTTLQWNLADELSGFNRGAAYVSRYVNPTWNPGATQVSGGVNPFSLSIGSITSLTPLGVGSGGYLPVNLLLFDGKIAGNNNSLFWKTASEENLSHFVLERSTTSSQFEEIARIGAKGNSQRIESYQFDDINFWDKTSQESVAYRLKSVDFDGSFTYSKAIVLKHNGLNPMPEPIVFPNPVNNHFSVLFSVQTEGEVSIELTNMNGRQIEHRAYNITAIGETLIEWENVSELTPGVYFLRLTSLDQTVKMIKLIKE